jgi:hypothetical protein
MTTTVEQPAVESLGAETPDAGVIEEARLRQRRQRGMAGVTIVVAGAFAAILLGGGGGGGGSRSVNHLLRPSSPASGAARSSSASCVFTHAKPLQGKPSKSLLSILGVLRRPATAADALPPTFRESLVNLGMVGDVFVRYIRRTRVFNGSPYYIYPAVFSGCGRQPPHQGIAELATHVHLGAGIIGGDGGGGGTARSIERAEDAGTGPPGSSTSATITMLVPDSVALVTLRYPAGRASGYSPKISPPVTITTAPVENEVVVTVPRSGGGGAIRKVRMIWRAADGHVVRTFNRL